MDCRTPGFLVHHQLLELTQTHVHRVGDAIQPSHPLSSPSPPAFNLSQLQSLCQWVSSSHQMAKVLVSNFSTSPSNEHSGLISFRMDCLALLEVQGTLKSLLQHHSSKASVLQCLVSAGFVDYHFRVFCEFSKRFHMYDNLSQTNGGNKKGGQANWLHEWKIKSVYLALRRGRLAALGNWAGFEYHTCWH